MKLEKQFIRHSEFDMCGRLLPDSSWCFIGARVLRPTHKAMELSTFSGTMWVCLLNHMEVLLSEA